MESVCKRQEKPLVSVVVPVYNAEAYIARAIESVLQQDVPLELLLVDDGSTDGTGELCKQYEADYADIIFYIKNETNKGVAESRNMGIRRAVGDYIAFLDADDWWEKGKLSHQISVLEETGCVLCATARELMTADGRTMNQIISVPEKITYKMLLKTNSIACSSVLMRADVAKEFEMCHDELHEDYIMWLRILQKYKTACGLNRPYLKSGMSKGGKSRDKRKSAAMTYGVYRYMGFSHIKAMYYFIWYALNGVLKYR